MWFGILGILVSLRLNICIKRRRDRVGKKDVMGSPKVHPKNIIMGSQKKKKKNTLLVLGSSIVLDLL